MNMFDGVRMTAVGGVCLLATFFCEGDRCLAAYPGIGSDHDVFFAVRAEEGTPEASEAATRTAAALGFQYNLLGTERREWRLQNRLHWEIIRELVGHAARYGGEILLEEPVDSTELTDPLKRSDFFKQCVDVGAAGVVMVPSQTSARGPESEVSQQAEKLGLLLYVGSQSISGDTPEGSLLFRLARAMMGPLPAIVSAGDARALLGSPAADTVRRIQGQGDKTIDLLNSEEGILARAYRQRTGAWSLAMTNTRDACSVNIPLGFLAEGRYLTTVSAEKEGSVEVTPKMLTSRDLLSISLESKGGAVVHFTKLSISPAGGSFAGAREITVMSVDPNAEIRYTLNDEEPSGDDPLYTKAVKILKSTIFRAKIMNGPDAGTAASAEFGKVAPRSPAILPEIPVFVGPMTVTIKTNVGVGEVRYTTDGSEPSDASPRYAGPFRLTEKATVRVRVSSEGLRGPLTAEREYGDPPPPDPYMPHVHISDVESVKAVSGWGGEPRKNRSIEDRPLSVAGKRYEKGIGTHAASELIYRIEPHYGRFVATAGLDDEKPAASMVFEVYADKTLLGKSDLIGRKRKKWQIKVPIPPGSRMLRLVVTDGGDGIGNDHADWVNAGFQFKSEK